VFLFSKRQASERGGREKCLQTTLHPKTAISDYYSLERCEYAVSQLVDDTEEDDEKEEEEEVQSSSLIKISSRDDANVVAPLFSLGERLRELPSASTGFDERRRLDVVPARVVVRAF